jgi:hypothetical protein
MAGKAVIFGHFPICCIWGGGDFFNFAKMQIDSTTHPYGFGFQPETEFEFWSLDSCQVFPCSEDILVVTCVLVRQMCQIILLNLMHSFSALSSDKLGMSPRDG